MSATLKSIDPATGAIIGSVPVDTPNDVARKVARARDAQRPWAAEPLERRIKALRDFRAGVERELPRLAELLTREVGKPITQSKNELNALLTRIDFFIQHTPEVVAREPVPAFGGPGTEQSISWEPLGVVANVSAWNYPYFVGSNVYVPALLTGNAVLYKPSELAVLSGLEVAKLLWASGVSQDVFQPIVGDGSVGACLVEQAVQGVFFTGSYATGKRIAASVGPRMIPMQLELGGKDPAYVCEDVDIAAAAEALADGAFYNAGQSCCGVERIYVHEHIYEAFLEALVATVQRFEVGDPLAEATYLGPLARGAAHVAELRSQVADAVQKGGQVLTGGGGLPKLGPAFFEPTVIRDATANMTVMRAESFGPVVGVAKVRDDDHAVAEMSDTEYGLTAAVYCPDRARAMGILARLDAGTVYHNCCDRVAPELPWSGRRHSGLGLTLSRRGIEAFVRPKAWHLRLT